MTNMQYDKTLNIRESALVQALENMIGIHSGLIDDPVIADGLIRMATNVLSAVKLECRQNEPQELSYQSDQVTGLNHPDLTQIKSSRLQKNNEENQ